MRILPALLYLTVFILSAQTFAGECKSQKTLSAMEQVARLDPKFSLDLPDLDFFEGGSAVAGYEYRVEPAYTDGLYSRKDKWEIKVDAVPGRLFEPDNALDFKISAGGRFATEATFYRFVKDPCQAMTLLPYTPRRMPLRARTAIGDKFKVGDYFIFKGSAGFVASAEILSMISSGFWGVGVGAHYLAEGSYQLHVVRLDDTKIRLKVVGRRGTRKRGSLNIGWKSDFEVFSVSLLDNGLEKLVNTTPLKLNVDFNTSNIFMLDYVLDLSDDEVADAFNKVIANAKSFKQLMLTNPFNGYDDISGMLLLDLSPLEDLFQADRRAHNLGRLTRNLRTTSSQTTKDWGVDLGNKIFGWEYERETATSLMGVRRPDNTVDHYLLKTWAKKKDARFFWTWSKLSERSGMRALFETNEDLTTSRPVNVVSYDYKKKNRLSFKKFEKIKLKLKKALPIGVYNSIPWSLWKQTKQDKFTNFGMRYDFVMAPEAISNAPQYSVVELANKFIFYTLRKGLSYEDYYTRRRATGPSRRIVTAKEQFERVLMKMSEKLVEVLDPMRPITHRMNLLSKLRRNKLFKESGLGFIMSLLPEKMASLYHLRLDISSNEGKIDFSYGDSDVSSLYKKLLTIKAALDKEELDLLREAESLSWAK